MAFISIVFGSRYTLTNNQLRTSSNPRNQATIQDSRVAMQNVKGRQTQGYACNGEKGNVNGIGTDDLDAFDSDCDEAPSTSAVLLTKLSAYDSNVLFEVPIQYTYQDKSVLDHSVQEMYYSKQPAFVNNSDIKITSDSNIISYDQYLKEKESEVVQVMKHDPLFVIDYEETLDLAEATRLKINEKQNDPIVKEKRVNIKPINYSSLNKLYKHFVPKKQLSAEQAFCLPISKTVSEQPPVQSELIQKEIPRELPSINVVKHSFLKMKSQLNDFDKIIKVRTKVTGQNEGTWGFEHIRKAFEKDVIPFVKSFRESFITFDQDRRCVKIEKKELLIENNRLLEQIIFQDIMCIEMHANVETKYVLPANDETLKYTEIEKKSDLHYSGNKCPLIRITSTTVVPPKKPVPTKVVKKTSHSRNNLGKPKATTSFMGAVRFGNDQVAAIMGYGDYQIVNVIISKGTNLYILSLEDMMRSSPICLLTKASKTKAWLWHRWLSYLNFGTINQLVKQGLVRGLPKLKYEKDHLCSACSLGKSKKHTHKPKSKDSIQDKLYLLHMDLCNPMRVESINGKKYILVIMDDYSSEDLGKLKPKVDIGILIGYSPLKKAYRIYNKQIMETIHVEFDELTIIAFEQFSSGPEIQPITPRTISPGLPSPSVVFHVPPAAALIPTDTTDVEGQETLNAQFDNDPFANTFNSDLSFEESTLRDVIESDLHPANQPFEHLSKWAKNHRLDNIIGNPS
ncbi:retrovirus-related pol polyprotein from transposon TNT 1-94 [Tanacetum coccineum]